MKNTQFLYRRKIILWHLTVTIFTTLQVFYIPLWLVFKEALPEALHSFYLLGFVVHLIDFIINLYGFSKRKKYIGFDFEEPKGVKYYFKTWFTIDFLSALPPGLESFFAPLALLRLLKLLRVGQYMHEWRQNEMEYGNNLRLLFLGFWLAVGSHTLTCGWLALGLHKWAAPDLVSTYLQGLYWTVTTLTTVGYGDITPEGNWQIIYTIMVELMGVGFYGYLIGNVASILSKRDPASSQYQDNMENLQSLIHYRKIPAELQFKIRNYYAYLWKKRLGYDESAFLEGLPKNLKNEVSFALKREMIERIPIFKDADPKFIEEISLHLKPVVITPDDYLFKEGDAGNEMYFVVRGSLLVMSADETKIYAQLCNGDFVGEMALINNKPRTATVKATGYCDLYRLRKIPFATVVSKHPNIAKQIEEIAIRRSAD